MKKYVIAEGFSLTANGHIYSAGEEISESVFVDRNYFTKLLSEKKILIVDEKSTNKEEKKEVVEETKVEKEVQPAVEETTSKKSSKKSAKVE